MIGPSTLSTPDPTHLFCEKYSALNGVFRAILYGNPNAQRHPQVVLSEHCNRAIAGWIIAMDALRQTLAEIRGKAADSHRQRSIPLWLRRERTVPPEGIYKTDSSMAGPPAIGVEMVSRRMFLKPRFAASVWARRGPVVPIWLAVGILTRP
jgi:hypothetical protein